MKLEWRKKEKSLYIPTQQAQLVIVPPYKFIALKGAGSPEEAHFSDCIGALYSLAYGIKMLSKRRQPPPANYLDYTVYPLEGIWDINDQAKATFSGQVNKNDFVYQLMIRQPDFVDWALYQEYLDQVKKKRSNPLLCDVEFIQIEEGPCIQMLHIGPYENEAASFAKMEDFATKNGLARSSLLHREIYLSDARKVAPEKLKTVLRFKVENLCGKNASNTKQISINGDETGITGVS